MDPVSLSAGVLSVVASVAIAALRLSPASKKKKKRAREKRSIVTIERLIGLDTVFEPTGTPEIDICFVHGLSGNSRSTWTAHNAKSNEDVFWPTELLGKSFPNARILVYGFETQVNSLCWLADRTLYHHATHLLNDLNTARADYPKRPLLFIAHSVGGLLVKSALVFAQDVANASRDADREVYLSTFGIISFGTPQVFAGNPPLTSFVNHLCTTQNLSRPRQFEDFQLPTWEKDIEALQTRLKSYKPIATEIPELFCYESFGKGVSMRKTTVPPKAPGIVHRLCEAVPIMADHRDICKFPTDNQDYEKVCEAISKFRDRSGSLLRDRRERFTNMDAGISSGKIRELGFSIDPNLPLRTRFVSRKDPRSREQYLDILHSRLLKERVAVIVGPGGVGKTTLVREYCYKQLETSKPIPDFTTIFWLDASCEKSLEESFLRVHEQLRSRYSQDPASQRTSARRSSARPASNSPAQGRHRYNDRHLKVRAVMDWFSFYENKKWLLIYDDVKHSGASYLQRFYPPIDLQRGYIIMTSREDYAADSGSEGIQEERLQVRTDTVDQGLEVSLSPASIQMKAEAFNPSNLTEPDSPTRVPMLGRSEFAQTSDSPSPKKLQFSPIRVKSFTRDESMDYLQDLDSPELRSIEPIRRRRTFDQVANNVYDMPQDLAHVGAFLASTPTPEGVPEELLKDFEHSEVIPSEYLRWIDTCVMLGPDFIPTLLLEIEFGKPHNHIVQGLERLKILGWVWSDQHYAVVQIPEFRRRMRRQELDGSHRGATSAQQACTSVVKTLQHLALRRNTISPEGREEQLLLKHMDACLDNYSEWATFLVECEWDTLANFCERNGLYAEAATFYEASLGQIVTEADTCSRRSESFMNVNSDDVDSDNWQDAQSSISVSVRDNSFDNGELSQSTHQLYKGTKASRALRNELGFIRMHIKLESFDGLEERCQYVMDKVSSRSESHYLDLKIEVLRQMIEVQVAKNAWPKAVRFSYSLADILEEEKGTAHEDTVDAIYQLATIHVKQGDYSRAEPLLEQVLKTYQQLFGNYHDRTILVSGDLAAVYKEHGDTDRAGALYRSIIRKYRVTLGAEHIRTARAEEGLAIVLDMEQNYRLADHHYEAALHAAKLLGHESEPYKDMSHRYRLLLERRKQDAFQVV